jgi:hypothetical protein
MKMPKGFNKWTLNEQENYFSKKLQELYQIEGEYRRILASIRGGQKVQYIVTERPDEMELKS